MGEMTHNLDHTISLLACMPATLGALLRGLPDAWTQPNEGGNTWNALDIVAHLIHTERADWIPRAKIVLQSGKSKTFEPFDRLGYVKEREGRQLGQLLDEFARLRQENLAELRALNLQPRDHALQGRHPAFGTVSLGQLLAAWAAHDLTHLHQLSRVMAHQYREAVGPWAAYLGVLQCTGHSSAA
jgi:hypothetical protein